MYKRQITDYADVKTMDKDEAVKAGLYVQIGKDVDDKYIAALKKQVKHQDAIDAVQKDIKIVYTPLPVSYTHLDVYKRQELRRLQIQMQQHLAFL